MTDGEDLGPVTVRALQAEGIGSTLRFAAIVVLVGGTIMLLHVIADRELEATDNELLLLQYAIPIVVGAGLLWGLGTFLRLYASVASVDLIRADDEDAADS